MRIFRYEIPVTDVWKMELPLGAQLLSVAPGRNGYHIDLWAKVPEIAPKVPHTFHIIGTGNPMPPLREPIYVGTAVMKDGMVWHVFEEPDPMSIKP